MDTKVCVRCGVEKELGKFRTTPSGGHKHTCRACKAKYERTKLKRMMLEALGHQCNCCGESHPQFLTLDHVQNDGASFRIHRYARVLKKHGIEVPEGNTEGKKWTTHQMLFQAAKEGWPKDRYQVLCMNCNFAKGHWGTCPHQTGKTTEKFVAEMDEILAWKQQRFRNYNGKSVATQMKPGFDGRRMQLNRRVLKPCSYCGQEFGSNEMVRHKREMHKDEFAKKRAECLAMGR